MGFIKLSFLSGQFLTQANESVILDKVITSFISFKHKETRVIRWGQFVSSRNRSRSDDVKAAIMQSKHKRFGIAGIIKKDTAGNNPPPIFSSHLLKNIVSNNVKLLTFTDRRWLPIYVGSQLVGIRFVCEIAKFI